MATNFPASLDTLTNPSATDTLDSPPHDEQHADANDAIEALQAKVGVDSSAVTSSLDYKVSDHGLRLSSLESAATGKILQVVSTTKLDAFSTASTSLVDITGLSVAITPSSASNKVLVIANSNMAHGSSAGEELQLVRDSTALCVSTSGSSHNGTFATNTNNASGNQMEPIAFSFLDSPATTSATTYKLQVSTAGGTVYVNRNTLSTIGATSTITVMEVSA